jgi:protein gp37
MGDTTEISWCDHTFNPWIGCTRVSAACDHCYAESLAKRYGWAKWGPGEPRKRTSEANWRKPLAWDGRPQRRQASGAACFAPASPTCSTTRSATTGAMTCSCGAWHAAPRLVDPHQEATGRKEVFASYTHPLPNVWLGTTVENQAMADLRIPVLLSIPAKVHFLSCEPLLGPVDLHRRSARRD